jgi:hypothetical protein
VARRQTQRDSRQRTAPFKAIGGALSGLAALVAVIAYFVPGPGSDNQSSSVADDRGSVSTPGIAAITRVRFAEEIAYGDFVQSLLDERASAGAGTNAGATMMVAQAGPPDDTGEPNQVGPDMSPGAPDTGSSNPEPPVGGSEDSRPAPGTTGTESTTPDVPSGQEDGGTGTDTGPGGVGPLSKPPPDAAPDFPVRLDDLESLHETAVLLDTLVSQADVVSGPEAAQVAALPPDLQTAISDPEARAKANLLVGVVANVTVRLRGRRRPKLRLSWRMLERARGDRHLQPLRERWFSRAKHKTYVPGVGVTTNLRVWVPIPRRTGSYVVSFALLDRRGDRLGRERSQRL